MVMHHLGCCFLASLQLHNKFFIGILAIINIIITFKAQTVLGRIFDVSTVPFRNILVDNLQKYAMVKCPENQKLKIYISC